MNKLFGKITRLAVSALMVGTMLPTCTTAVLAKNTTPYAATNVVDLLGDSAEYGVTANSITLTGHMDSNFAAKNYASSGDGNITLGQYTNDPGSVVVGKLNSALRLTTSGTVTVQCTEADSTKVSVEGSGKSIISTDTETNIDNYIDNLMKDVSDKAVAMLRNNSLNVGTDIDAPNSGSNDYEIDLSKFDDGTFYISNSDAIWGNHIPSGGLKIKKRDTQTIVFNFTGTSVDLNEFYVRSVDTNGNLINTYDSAIDTSKDKNVADEVVAKTVIFNMPNATSFTMDAGVSGIFIAPKATVDVAHTSAGWLICNSISKNGGEWHSVYQHVKKTINPGSFSLSATKTVDGEPATSDQKFNFTLNEYSDSTFTGTVKHSETVQNNGGSISMDFSKMSFDPFNVISTRYFTLSESPVSGYVTNNTIYYIKVDTSVEGGNLTSTYTPEATIYSDSAMTAPVTAMLFNNETYAKTTLSVKKHLANRNNWKTNENYSFTLTGVNGAPIPEDASGKTAVVTSQDGEASFGEITYTSAGTYQYTITEVIPDDNEKQKSVTYTTKTVLATVTVAEKDNKLVADVVYGDTNSSETPIFTNTYTPAATTATISGTKAMANRAFQSGDAFSFTISGKDGAPVPENKRVTINPTSGTTARFGFDAISYQLSDLGGKDSKTFEYTIHEEETTMAGVQNDVDKTVYVKVTRDPATGALSTEVSYKDATELKFTNTYTATDTTAKLSGTKYLSGRDFKYGDIFTFEISNPKDVDQPLPGRTSVTINPTNGKSMEFNFDAINYKFSDLNGQSSREFVYYITETSNITGVTNDSNEHTATVILKDNFNGTMSTSVTYDKENVSSLKFVNNYNASGEFDLSVTKSISGREWNDDDSFTFNVIAEAGSPVAEKTTATATKASQVASFGTIKFEKAGTYKYDISEKIPADATKTEDNQYVLNGVVYDSIKHVVTITVIDNGDGTLTATSDAGTSLKVTNSYTDIKFNKYDSNNNQLSGANLALYEDGSDTALDTWTSSADAERLGDYLVRGHSYVIRELSAPAGYGTFEDIKFTLNADGTVTGLESLTKDASGAYKLIDAVLDVKFVKETTDGTALSGASLELLDADGKVVDQWVSDGTAHAVKGLTAGAKYTLHEVSAPERYIVAEDITFTVENTKAAQTITMTDEHLVTPFNPDTPDKPDTPTTPDHPTTPNTPDRPTTPNTGDQTNAAGAAGALAFSMLLAGFAFFFRRKYSD